MKSRNKLFGRHHLFPLAAALVFLQLQAIKADVIKNGAQEPFALVDFTNATLSSDGSRECVNTTGLVEVYEKKPVYKCTHATEEQCHYTYVTQFEPTQEEECEDNYEKSCKVTYNKVAKNETHKHCYQPLERQCDGEPAKRTVCKDWPETFCSTKYAESQTNDGQFVADTSCERVQTRVCVPVNCAMIPGDEKCHEKVTAVVDEQPEENCELIPYQNCILKTKLVPSLKAIPVCTQVPRQFCSVNYERGEKIQKEILSIWCRVVPSPTEEEISDPENPTEVTFEATTDSLADSVESTTSILSDLDIPSDSQALLIDYDSESDFFITSTIINDLDETTTIFPYVDDEDLPSYTTMNGDSDFFSQESSPTTILSNFPMATTSEPEASATILPINEYLPPHQETLENNAFMPDNEEENPTLPEYSSPDIPSEGVSVTPQPLNTFTEEVLPNYTTAPESHDSDTEPSILAAFANYGVAKDPEADTDDSGHTYKTDTSQYTDLPQYSMQYGQDLLLSHNRYNSENEDSSTQKDQAGMMNGDGYLPPSAGDNSGIAEMPQDTTFPEYGYNTEAVNSDSSPTNIISSSYSAIPVEGLYSQPTEVLQEESAIEIGYLPPNESALTESDSPNSSGYLPPPENENLLPTAVDSSSLPQAIKEETVSAGNGYSAPVEVGIEPENTGYLPPILAQSTLISSQYSAGLPDMANNGFQPSTGYKASIADGSIPKGTEPMLENWSATSDVSAAAELDIAEVSATIAGYFSPKYHDFSPAASSYLATNDEATALYSASATAVESASAENGYSPPLEILSSHSGYAIHPSGKDIRSNSANQLRMGDSAVSFGNAEKAHLGFGGNGYYSSTKGELSYPTPLSGYSSASNAFPAAVTDEHPHMQKSSYMHSKPADDLPRSKSAIQDLSWQKETGTKEQFASLYVSPPHSGKYSVSSPSSNSAPSQVGDSVRKTASNDDIAKYLHFSQTVGNGGGESYFPSNLPPYQPKKDQLPRIQAEKQSNYLVSPVASNYHPRYIPTYGNEKNDPSRSYHYRPTFFSGSTPMQHKPAVSYQPLYRDEISAIEQKAGKAKAYGNQAAQMVLPSYHG